VPGRNLADWQAFSEQKFGGQPPAGQTGAPGTGNSVKVGNQTFNRPANFTDAQWNAYKKSVGVQ
jgi:hypothetical protein